MSDLPNVFENVNQLKHEDRIHALLHGVKETAETAFRQLQALMASGMAQLEPVSDALMQIAQGAHLALEAHQMSGTTGDPSNPVHNPAPGNPDLPVPPNPDGGQTGDPSNPIQNPVPDPEA